MLGSHYLALDLWLSFLAIEKITSDAEINETINRRMLINHQIIFHLNQIHDDFIFFSNAKLSDTSDYSALFIRQSTSLLYNYLSFIIRRFVFLFDLKIVESLFYDRTFWLRFHLLFCDN